MKAWHLVVFILLALSAGATYLEYRITCAIDRCGRNPNDGKPL